MTVADLSRKTFFLRGLRSQSKFGHGKVDEDEDDQFLKISRIKSHLCLFFFDMYRGWENKIRWLLPWAKTDTGMKMAPKI